MSNRYQLGDHLVIDCGLYTHHGLYVGNNQVIHYAGYALGSKTIKGTVEEVTLDSFAQGKAITRQIHLDPLYTPNEAVNRARSRIGEQSYSLLFNNCEQFVNWCLEGKSHSEQTQNLGHSALMTVGTQVAVSLAEQAITRGVRQSGAIATASRRIAGSGSLTSIVPPLSLVVGMGLVGYGLYRLLSD